MMTFGCSSFSWDTEDGRHLLGRTYDRYGDLSGNRLAVVPRGYGLRAEIREDSRTLVTGRYGYAGMAVMGLHAPLMVDGINERGLMGALLHYPGYAVYNEHGGEGQKPVHPAFLLGYLLGTCGSIEEAVKAAEGLFLTPETIFGEKMPVHYLLADRSGEAAVLEPEEGGIRIHRNTIGVMTNSPDYPWHWTNLQNHGSLKEVPADYSSPSRFLRTALLKRLAVRGKDEGDGVNRMFHNLSAVDTPEGAVLPGKHGNEKTLCMSVMCAESGNYYIATFENRRISVLRLARELEKPGTGVRYLPIPERQDVGELG